VENYGKTHICPDVGIPKLPAGFGCDAMKFGRQVSLKRCTYLPNCMASSQKTVILIFITMRTPNPVEKFEFLNFLMDLDEMPFSLVDSSSKTLVPSHQTT
jgi:hypothetical protein